MKAKIVKRCIAAGEWRAAGDVVEVGAEEYEILFRSGGAEQYAERVVSVDELLAADMERGE